ncbi:MAG: YigZ family protein [Flavobacteriales bacterium]|nr:YigZ family protein [Flavobacteriales bacterium]
MKLGEQEGTYFTTQDPTEFNHKVLGSKHLAYLLPVKSEEQIRELLGVKRKEHHSATHVCYAWRLKTGLYRSSDDGEPSGTAGKPILNQILHFDLFDVLIVVVRYFGGTKLGTGGLMDAYKQAARGAIESVNIVELPRLQQFSIAFGYEEMPRVMSLVKQYEGIKISMDQNEKVHLIIEVKTNLASILMEELAKNGNVETELL